MKQENGRSSRRSLPRADCIRTLLTARATAPDDNLNGAGEIVPKEVVLRCPETRKKTMLHYSLIFLVVALMREINGWPQLLRSYCRCRTLMPCNAGAPFVASELSVYWDG